MASNKQIVLVGAGPVGTLLAAALCESKQPFIWVVRNAGMRQQLDEFSLQFPDGSVSVPLHGVEIIRGLEAVPDGSLIITAVKAQDEPGLLKELEQVKPAGLLRVGNGLKHGPAGIGLLYGGGFIKSGVLVTSRNHRLVAGGTAAEPAEFAWARQALDGELVSVTISSHIRELMWIKLTVNCVVNPLTAILDCDNGDLLGRLHGPLVMAILGECRSVMMKDLADDRAVPEIAELLLSIKEVLAATRNNSSSMREDMRLERTTEINQLNGAIVSEGLKHGLSCPVNEQIVGMISLLSESPPSRRIRG